MAGEGARGPGRQGEWGDDQGRVPLSILMAPHGVPVAGRNSGETGDAACSGLRKRIQKEGRRVTGHKPGQGAPQSEVFSKGR